MFLFLMKRLWLNRTALYKKKWNRVLPFGDAIVDRWEKAELLGFGKNSSIYDSSLVFGDVIVGNNVWIGPFTILDGSGGTLTIGDYSCISAGVHIYTHDTVQRTITAGNANKECAPTTIGERCYIGPYSVITKGVSIGNGSIIGAFSLVSKNIPENTKAFGIPIKEHCTII